MRGRDRVVKSSIANRNAWGNDYIDRSSVVMVFLYVVFSHLHLSRTPATWETPSNPCVMDGDVPRSRGSDLFGGRRAGSEGAAPYLGETAESNLDHIWST